jgi:hypothetical protein
MRGIALALLVPVAVVVACSSTSSDGSNAPDAGMADAGDATSSGDGTAPSDGSGSDVATDSSSPSEGGADVAAVDVQDAAPGIDAPPSIGARCDTGTKIYEGGDGNLRGAYASLYFYVPLPDGGSEEHFCMGPLPSDCHCEGGGTCVLPDACPPGAPCGVTMADGIPGNVATGTCF